MSEARKKILSMLAEGKITVEQSEDLLKAVDADQKTGEDKTAGQKNGDQNTGSTGSKRNFGSDMSNMAHEFHSQVREAVKNIEPQTREIKNRLKELGGWVQDTVGSMMKDFSFDRHGPVDGMEVNFTVPAPDGISNCRSCDIHNQYGSLTLKQGSEFSLAVKGKISRAELGNEFPLNWFLNNALTVRGDTLIVGMEKPNTFKAVLHLALTLPVPLRVKLKAVSGPTEIKGKFELESAISISGDLAFSDVCMTNTSLDTVSGNIDIENAEIKNVNIKLTSGNLNIRGGCFGTVTANNISGSILVERPRVDEQSKLCLLTTSGDVHLKSFSGSINKLEADTRTGDLINSWGNAPGESNRHGVVLDNNIPGAQVNIESTSGDIQLD